MVRTSSVIVPPKEPPKDSEVVEQVKFRWPRKDIERVKRIAEKTHRSMNEAGLLLMRWALDKSEAELEAEPSPKPTESKRAKK